MKRSALFLALGLMLGAAASGFTGSTSIESAKASGDEAFDAVALTLEGKAASLRCSTRMRFRSSGYHNRCPYGRVVTGVQVLDGNIAVLTCAEVAVTCR